MKKIDFESMGLELLTTGTASSSAYGVVYRKGKGLGDVVKAAKKAKDPKYGRAKTECEINSMALFLNGIFKAAPSPAPNAAKTTLSKASRKGPNS